MTVMGWPFIVVLALVLSTFAVLMVGVILMGRGGAINKKLSNRLMIARVSLQFMAVAVIGVLFYLMKH